MANSEQQPEGPLQLVLEVPDRETLRLVLGTLNEDDLDVRTQTITSQELTADTSVTVDLDLLTEKQREALELALSEGYYQRPREADLTVLSEALDISKSAVSQRLRTAEQKLITRAFGQYQ